MQNHVNVNVGIMWYIKVWRNISTHSGQTEHHFWNFTLRNKVKLHHIKSIVCQKNRNRAHIHTKTHFCYCLFVLLRINMKIQKNAPFTHFFFFFFFFSVEKLFHCMHLYRQYLNTIFSLIFLSNFDFFYKKYNYVFCSASLLWTQSLRWKTNRLLSEPPFIITDFNMIK